MAVLGSRADRRVGLESQSLARNVRRLPLPPAYEKMCNVVRLLDQRVTLRARNGFQIITLGRTSMYLYRNIYVYTHAPTLHPKPFTVLLHGPCGLGKVMPTLTNVSSTSAVKPANHPVVAGIEN